MEGAENLTFGFFVVVCCSLTTRRIEHGKWRATFLSFFFSCWNSTMSTTNKEIKRIKEPRRKLLIIIKLREWRQEYSRGVEEWKDFFTSLHEIILDGKSKQLAISSSSQQLVMNVLNEMNNHQIKSRRAFVSSVECEIEMFKLHEPDSVDQCAVYIRWRGVELSQSEKFPLTLFSSSKA